MDPLKNKIIGKIDYIIDNFENKSIKHGIYIYGNNGIGKTTKIKKMLNERYNCIWYNAMDKITKQTVDSFSSNNIANNSIMTIFNKKATKTVIIMDDIENIHYTDKNILTLLVKLIRPKKTKKQQAEAYSINPIVFIANRVKDKKIIELMSSTINIEIGDVPIHYCRDLIHERLPLVDKITETNILNLCNNNLSTLTEVLHFYKNKIFIKDNLNYITNNTTKDITQNILVNDCRISEFNNMISEGDRTIISLLYHENISRILDILPNDIKISIYSIIISNICICDYIDRFIFQKQIWELTELSNLIKIFYNNLLLRQIHKVDSMMDIQFTKVLTKYSSEYNNYTFLVKLCKQLSCNKKDIYLIIDSNDKLFNRMNKLYHDCSFLDSTSSL